MPIEWSLAHSLIGVASVLLGGVMIGIAILLHAVYGYASPLWMTKKGHTLTMGTIPHLMLNLGTFLLMWPCTAILGLGLQEYLGSIPFISLLGIGAAWGSVQIAIRAREASSQIPHAVMFGGTLGLVANSAIYFYWETTGGWTAHDGHELDMAFGQFASLFYGILISIACGILARKIPRTVTKAMTSGFMAGGILGGIFLFRTVSRLSWWPPFSSVGYGFLIVVLILKVGEIGALAGLLSGLALFFGRIATWGGRALSVGSVPLLASIRDKTLICAQCYRYTVPRYAFYEQGTRFCEHCHHQVERTDITGKVIVACGPYPLETDERTFILSVADVLQQERPIDFSIVYIHPDYTDTMLLERFLTTSLNFPPRKGLRAVHLVYHRDLAELGTHLHNSLRNTFGTIEQIH